MPKCNRSSLAWPIKAFISENVVYLSDARHIGGMLPALQVGRDTFQQPLLLLMLLFYIPILIVSKVLAIPIDRITKPWYSMTYAQKRATQIVMFLAWT